MIILYCCILNQAWSHNCTHSSTVFFLSSPRSVPRIVARVLLSRLRKINARPHICLGHDICICSAAFSYLTRANVNKTTCWVEEKKNGALCVCLVGTLAFERTTVVRDALACTHKKRAVTVFEWTAYALAPTRALYCTTCNALAWHARWRTIFVKAWPRPIACAFCLLLGLHQWPSSGVYTHFLTHFFRQCFTNACHQTKREDNRLFVWHEDVSPYFFGT